MSEELLHNEARILDAPDGLCILSLAVLSRIANDKRRAVLAELALKQLTELEQVVADMEYEEVERTYENLKPTIGANGSETTRDINTTETTL